MKPKIFTTVFFFLLFSTITLGQKSLISLSFTGIANGQYAQLSRIDIRNLDKSCDTTLYWPDTVLVLDPIVGMNDLHSFSENFRVFQNVPNPIKENTKILLYLPESGNVAIDVSLFNGKQVASFSQELKRGYHSFLFTPATAETYIFTATCKSVKKSIKMVSSLSRSSSGCSLVYTGAGNEFEGLKSVETSANFVFSVGDLLEYTAYYNGLTNTLLFSPTQSTLITFIFYPSGTPCPGIPTVTYSGQTYNTVQIGAQCWFKENLNVGSRINGSQEQTDNSIIEKYCYNDDVNNCVIYGGLYQWDEVMQYVITEGAKGICPAGWHLPTDAEWTTLTTFLGGENVAGGKLKETGTTHWASPNTGATNETGFTALPGGTRGYNGYFYSLTGSVYFWSSSQNDVSGAWDRDLLFSSEDVYRGNEDKTFGFSCRCVQD